MSELAFIEQTGAGMGMGGGWQIKGTACMEVLCLRKTKGLRIQNVLGSVRPELGSRYGRSQM